MKLSTIKNEQLINLSKMLEFVYRKYTSRLGIRPRLGMNHRYSVRLPREQEYQLRACM